MSGKKQETYYQLLKIEPRASLQQIENAYHQAKNAFANSQATYMLYSAEESQSILDELEQAYYTLSNLKRREEYDKSIQLAPLSAPPSPTTKKTTQPSSPSPSSHTQKRALSPLNLEIHCGKDLKTAREKQGYTQEEVTQITRISKSHLEAIETDNLSKLPARVYVQGFVRNLANLYRLETSKACQSYLSYLDEQTKKAS